MTQIGSVIDGKYRVIDQIGEGGMSVVWLVTDSRLNKQWAIKEIKKNARTETHKVIVDSLRAEANLMKGLDHPALPRIVDIIEDGDSLYVVMDFIQGEDLLSIMKNHRRVITEADVVDWGIQLCDALTYLHSKGIVYRDMKPGNVMLMNDGMVKIIDFGIAREYSPDKEDDTMPLGTRGYASPEAFKRGVQTTPVSDIYSLGVTLFHLVTGHGPMEYVDQPTLPPIRMINPTLSEGLEYVIIKATQWSPAERYQSCNEMRYDLENLGNLTKEHRRKLERTMMLFKVSAIAGVACLVLGIAFMVASNLVRSSSYEDIMTRASTASVASQGDQPSAAEELYMQAIEVSPTSIDPYMRLVDSDYRQMGVYIADNDFTKEESKRWKSLYQEHQNDIKRSNEYAELCYDAGLAYMLYYSYGDDLTSNAEAVSWFKEAVNNATGSTLTSDELNIAQAYITIGEFSQRLSASSKTGAEGETYEEYWGALESACSSIDSGTPAIARLRLYDTAFKAIASSSYLAGFANRAGISEARVSSLLEEIYSNTMQLEGDALQSDEGTRLYNDIVDNYSDALYNIDSVYNNAGTRQGNSGNTGSNAGSSKGGSSSSTGGGAAK